MRPLFFSFSFLLLLFLSWGCRRETPRQGPVFDVPSLVGKRPAELDKILGPPAANNANNANTSANAGEARKTWRRDSFLLHSMFACAIVPARVQFTLRPTGRM